MLDVYQEITDRIVAALESGHIPWRKPWSVAGCQCISYATGKPYSLANQILLEGRSGFYLTFAEVKRAGGYVRKGAKGKWILFWRMADKRDGKTTVLSDGTVVKEQIPMLRVYTVFHIDDCEGVSPRHSRPASDCQLSPDAHAEEIIRNYVQRSGVKYIVRQSSQAYYSPISDTVVVPELSQYEDRSLFYSTNFHELSHSTSHPSRLNRDVSGSSFGNMVYSAEELTAELSSCYLMNLVGLETPESFKDSVAYLQGWSRALAGNKRLFVKAASDAAKACAYILGEEPENED